MRATPCPLGAAPVIERLQRLELGDVSLRLARAWPRGVDRLLLEYTDPEGRAIAGQWCADLHRTAQVTRATGPGCVDVGGGVLLQPDGADRRLRCLAALVRRPDHALVVHRPERRAVLHDRHRDQFARVLPRGRLGAAVRAHRAVLALGTVRVPALVGVSSSTGRMVVETLPGRSLHELLLDPTVTGPDLRRAAAAVGRELRALHDAPVPPALPEHGPLEEVATLTRWLRAGRALATLPAGAPAAVRAAAEGLLAEGAPTPRRLVHRDLHDKQAFVHSDRAGLIDLDTLAVGDPALDVANLLVHLDLRVLQGVQPHRARDAAQGFLSGYGPDGGLLARLDRHAHCVRARLALVYALRPAHAAAGARLLDAPSRSLPT